MRTPLPHDAAEAAADAPTATAAPNGAVGEAEDARRWHVVRSLAGLGKIEIPHTKTTTTESVLVEYVSANPHTPLLLRHARGAAVGDALAALLTRVGHNVRREYYWNDSLSSLTLRGFVRAVEQEASRQAQSEDVAHNTAARRQPAGVAHVAAVARRFRDERGTTTEGAPANGAEDVINAAAGEHRDLLRAFGTEFDEWTAESSLYAPTNRVAQMLADLQASGHVETRDGAAWLRSFHLGDAQDRVLVRADGRDTYLAADLCYHLAKYERGFGRMIDVWDADHAGYIARTMAGLRALGKPTDRLQIVLCGASYLLESSAAVSASILAANSGGGSGTANDAMSGGAEMTMREAMARLGPERLRVGLLYSDVAAPVVLHETDGQIALLPLLAAHRRARELAGPNGENQVLEAAAATLPNMDEATRRVTRLLARLPDDMVEAARALAPTHLLRALVSLAEAFLVATARTAEIRQNQDRRLLARAVEIGLNDGLASVAVRLPASS